MLHKDKSLAVMSVGLLSRNTMTDAALTASDATVALPASATTVVSDKKSAAYTQKYLQQSANFYAALDHKTRS